MTATLADKNIEYSSRIYRNDLIVYADPELLEHAFLNLLRNAIDAVAQMPEPRIAMSGIDVEHRQSGGTEFTFILPVR